MKQVMKNGKGLKNYLKSDKVEMSRIFKNLWDIFHGTLLEFCKIYFRNYLGNRP